MFYPPNVTRIFLTDKIPEIKVMLPYFFKKGNGILTILPLIFCAYYTKFSGAILNTFYAICTKCCASAAYMDFLSAISAIFAEFSLVSP